MNPRAQAPLPRFLQIEPVGQCNLRCEMCAVVYRSDAPADGSPAFMPFERFCALIDQFADVEELQLQGLGEPMMHPRFFDMVSHAVRRGISVSTNSNLTLLTDERAQACVESGLAALHVSLDGATAEVYESIRHGASFSKVVRNLDRLVQARARTRSRTPRIRIVMVVMRKNLDQIAEVVELARRHGVDSVFVQHLSHDFQEPDLPAAYVPMRRFANDQTLLAEDRGRIAQAFSRARARAKDLDVELRLPRLEQPSAHSSMGCEWPWRGAYLTYRGDALPCCMVSAPDRFKLGNMADDGVESVWNGAAYVELRERLAGDDPPPICKSCSLYRRTF